MSTNNKDKYVVGLVKQKPFTMPASFRSTALNPAIKFSINEFSENTDLVIRVPGLSSPIEGPPGTATLDLSLKAFKVVMDTLRRRPGLNDHSFTIIDGTSWVDAIATENWGLDIVSINVFWQGRQPVIAVMLGKRKVIKNSKTYHLEDPESHFPVVFDFNPHAGGITDHSRIYETVAELNRIRNATGCLNPGGVFHKYGRSIMAGLGRTMRSDKEYPVAAAAYHDDVIWYVDRPWRHHHIVHSKEYVDAKSKTCPKEKPEIQGFLTNHGNFITRYRGMYQAVLNLMIVDTPPTLIDIVLSTTKEFYEIERGMGGILRYGDINDAGYRIATTPLFSEDLW